MDQEKDRKFHKTRSREIKKRNNKSELRIKKLSNLFHAVKLNGNEICRR